MSDEPINQTPGISVVSAAPSPVGAPAPSAGATVAPISPAEHAELSAKLKEPGSDFGQVMAQFWRDRAQPQTAQAPQNSQAQPQATAPQGDQPTAPQGEAPDPVELDATLRDLSEGRANGKSFTDLVSFGTSIDKDMQKLDTKAFNARFEQGMVQVQAQVYGGDAGRLAEGVQEMQAAASVLMGGDPKRTREFLAEVDRSGALSQPAFHHQALEYARLILGRRPSVFRRK